MRALHTPQLKIIDRPLPEQHSTTVHSQTTVQEKDEQHIPVFTLKRNMNDRHLDLIMIEDQPRKRLNITKETSVNALVKQLQAMQFATQKIFLKRIDIDKPPRETDDLAMKNRSMTENRQREMRQKIIEGLRNKNMEKLKGVKVVPLQTKGLRLNNKELIEEPFLTGITPGTQSTHDYYIIEKVRMDESEVDKYNSSLPVMSCPQELKEYLDIDLDDEEKSRSSYDSQDSNDEDNPRNDYPSGDQENRSDDSDYYVKGRKPRRNANSSDSDFFDAREYQGEQQEKKHRKGSYDAMAEEEDRGIDFHARLYRR